MYNERSDRFHDCKLYNISPSEIKNLHILFKDIMKWIIKNDVPRTGDKLQKLLKIESGKKTNIEIPYILDYKVIREFQKKGRSEKAIIKAIVEITTNELLKIIEKNKTDISNKI